MSNIKKCDRCGNVYEPGTKSRMLFEYYSKGISSTKNCGDVCPKCAAKFDKWWNKYRSETA